MQPTRLHTLCHWLECPGCGPAVPAVGNGSLKDRLRERKDDAAAMMHLRSMLDRCNECLDLARMHDDLVIDQVVRLVAAGRLRICSKGTGKTPAVGDKAASARRAKPAATKPMRPSLRGLPDGQAAAITPSQMVAMGGGRERPAAPPPPPQARPAAAAAAAAAAAVPAKEVLHWFTVALKAAPELKARPAWWPAAAGSPVGYGGTRARVTLPGVSPPEQTLDAGGQFHVDLIPPGSAKVEFPDYFATFDAVFKAGTRF
jgi:hypothetical protein